MPNKQGPLAISDQWSDIERLMLEAAMTDWRSVRSYCSNLPGCAKNRIPKAQTIPLTDPKLCPPHIKQNLREFMPTNLVRLATHAYVGLKEAFGRLIVGNADAIEPLRWMMLWCPLLYRCYDAGFNPSIVARDIDDLERRLDGEKIDRAPREPFHQCVMELTWQTQMSMSEIINGKTTSDDVLPYLLRPFWQLDGMVSRVAHATGLLTRKARVSLDIIKQLPPETGLFAREICNKLEAEGIYMDENTFRTHIFPPLKPHGVINKRGLGYLIDPSHDQPDAGSFGSLPAS